MDLTTQSSRLRQIPVATHGKLGLLVFVADVNLALLAIVGAERAPLGLYEPDIYAAVSPFSWVAIFLALMIPAIIFAYCIAANCLTKTLTHWLVAAFVAANFAFLMIPTVRYPSGYDRWDSWYHLAETDLVIQTGHFSANNVYPAVHVLFASLNRVSGVSLSALFSFSPALTSGFIMIIAYVACDLMGIEEGGRFAAVVGTSTVLNLPLVLPLSFSVLFLIVTIGIVFKNETSTGLRIVFVLCMTALAITHLLTAISVVIGLVAIVLLTGRNRGRIAGSLFLSSVIVAAWVFFMTEVYFSPIRVVAEIIATGTFQGRGYFEILAGAGLTGAAAFVVVAGILLSRIGLGALGLPSARIGATAIIHGLASRESKLGGWTVANLSVLLVLGSLFGSGTLGAILDRFLNFGLFAVVFLAGLSIHRLSKSAIKRGLVALVLCTIMILGQAFFFYPAPGTGRYNWETGTTDLSGLAWIGHNVRNGNDFVGSTYNHAILSGLIGREKATELGLAFGMVLPSHLGCPANPGSSADFIIVTAFDLYVLDRRGDLRPEDITCVAESGQYSMVYDNGAFWILIRSPSYPNALS